VCGDCVVSALQGNFLVRITGEYFKDRGVVRMVSPLGAVSVCETPPLGEEGSVVDIYYQKDGKVIQVRCGSWVCSVSRSCPVSLSSSAVLRGPVLWCASDRGVVVCLQCRAPAGVGAGHIFEVAARGVFGRAPPSLAFSYPIPVIDHVEPVRYVCTVATRAVDIVRVELVAGPHCSAW
jgi:hypothetical protein